MVEITIRYQGQLRTEATHVPSGSTLQTDAPKDNKGKGENFSPTDLVATALGSCMLTVMGIAAQTLGIDIGDATVRVAKEMQNTPVRRIAALRLQIHVPATLRDDVKEKLTQAAMHCPVHKSLHPDVQMPIKFTWG